MWNGFYMDEDSIKEKILYLKESYKWDGVDVDEFAKRLSNIFPLPIDIAKSVVAVAWNTSCVNQLECVLKNIEKIFICLSKCNYNEKEIVYTNKEGIMSYFDTKDKKISSACALRKSFSSREWDICVNGIWFKILKDEIDSSNKEKLQDFIKDTHTPIYEVSNFNSCEKTIEKGLTKLVYMNEKEAFLFEYDIISCL